MTTILDFRIGDVFDADDSVGLWILTIAIAFNDITFTNVEHDAAEKEWERFYWWRLSVGHYNEVMLYLEHQRREPAIVEFIEASAVEVRESHKQALRLYDEDCLVADAVRERTALPLPEADGDRGAWTSRARHQGRTWWRDLIEREDQGHAPPLR